MEKKQISMLVATMFAGAGIAGVAHAGSSDPITAGNSGVKAGTYANGVNFYDRQNPDNGEAQIPTYDNGYVLRGGTNFAAAGATADRAGIAIGDRARAVGNDQGSGNDINGGAIAIGQGAQGLHNSATAIGTVALASGNTSLAIGRQSAATGDFSMALGNVADATGTSALAFGHSAQATGKQAVAIGGAASDGIMFDSKTNTKATGARTVAIGAGAQATADDQVAIGSNAISQGVNTTKTFGETAQFGGTVSFGSNSVKRQVKNVAAGADGTDAVNVNQLTNVQSGLSTAIGSVDQRVTNVNTALSTSIDNSVKTLNQTIDAKTKNAVKFTDDSHAAISLDGQGGTTISGVKAGVKDGDAVNVGQLNTKAGDITNSVTNNVTNSINNGATNAVIYDSSKRDNVTLGGVGAKSTVALHNVAAGTADTDAVNVGQIKPLQSSLSTAASNITNLQTNVSNLSTSVTNIGSSLSTAVTDIGGLKEADKRNVKYDGKSGFDSVTLQGANGTTIKNVAAGQADTDATNVGQLKSGLSNVTNNVNQTISTSVSNLSTSVTQQIGAATKNAVQYDGDDHSRVTLGGKNASAPVALSNVATGVNATDAVNVGQLTKASGDLNTSINNVDARVTQVDGRVTNVDQRVTQNTTNIGALQQDALQWSKSAGAYDASHNSGSAQKITNVAAGDVSAASTDAINGAQLKSVQDQINGNIGGATKNAVVYDTDAQGNRTNSVSLVGGASGPVTIDNVAAGTLSANSTQAVNGSQLYATNQQVGANTTAITNIDGRVAQNTTNISNLQASDTLSVKYDTAAKNAVTLGGTNAAAPVALSNVADGVAKNDAVNVGQLSNATGNLQSQINTTNSTVTTIGGQVTTNTQNITALQQADTRNVKYDGAQGFDTVTLNGANGTTVTNVKAGALTANSTDAVNGSQLFATNQNVKQQGDSITQLGNSLTSIDGRVTQNTTNIGALQQDALQWSTSAGAYDASHGSGSAQKITNVAAGDVSAASTDAINGAQLKSVQDQINGNIGGATKNAVQYDTDKDGKRVNSVTLGGGQAGPVTITNVAAGALNANSTDAVNGAQLFRTNSNLTTQTNRVDNLTTNVSKLTSDLSVTNTNVSNLQAADKLNVKYDAAAKNTVTLGGAGHAPVTLSNVADGVAKNDAVNVGQLSKATGGLQSQIDVQGDKITNVDQRVTTNTTNIGQNTTDITALKQDALQWNAGIGAYDASHGTVSPQTIANVKAGQADTDAVNVKQLKDSVSSGVNNGATNAVLYDDSSKRQVTLGAGNGGVSVRLTNVAEGGVQAGSLDAVNGSQLRYATDSTAAALGGGASANTNGSINAPKYDIGGTSFNNVGDALGNLDGRVTSNTTIISGLQRDALQFDPTVGAYNAARDGVATKITSVADGNLAAGSNDAVNGGQLFGVKTDLQQQITNVSNQAGEAVKNVVKYDVDASGNRLNSVSLVGGNAASPVVLKNIAEGVSDNDAVNMKQLKNVQSGISQLGEMAVRYDDSSKSIITLGGGTGGTKITNVQAGTLSATSKDAVNGSQLYATNQQVAKNTTDITNLQENVTNVTNGKAGLVQQQDPNGQITVGAGTGGTSVNIANNAGGNRVLTGVGAGVNSNDAVNVGQLNTALRDVSANQAIKAAATDANTTWITRAEAGSFGSTATASGKNAVAVGQGSVADRDNSFSVGAKGSERQVTNVAAGTAPTDAVNVQQLNDNVAASRSYTDQRVGQVYNDLNTVKKDMFGGVASAMAVAGLPQPTAPGRSMVSAATANYRGQQGFAAGYSYVTQNDKWVVKAAVTGNTRSDFGAVVGAGYQF